MEMQTKKEMHTVVNCRMLCTVDPKQFCTSNFVFLPVVFNINDDNIFFLNLEQYVYKQFKNQ
jgi:hypothetical protein